MFVALGIPEAVPRIDFAVPDCLRALSEDDVLLCQCEHARNFVARCEVLMYYHRSKSAVYLQCMVIHVGYERKYVQMVR